MTEATKTKTQQIFECTAPFNNPYQGKDPRILFVCSAGLLRSATGANEWAKKGYNTRNAGSSPYALIPLSANLIAWSEKIVFVKESNFEESKRTFADQYYLQEMLDKSIVLDIPDNFDYRHPELIKRLEEQLEGKLRAVPATSPPLVHEKMYGN